MAIKGWSSNLGIVWGLTNHHTIKLATKKRQCNYTLQSLAVTVRTTRFNIHKIYLAFTLRSCILCGSQPGGLRGWSPGQLPGAPTCKGRQDLTGINGNVVSVTSGVSHMRKNFLASLGTLAPSKTFILQNCPEPRNFKEYRFEGEPNF